MDERAGDGKLSDNEETRREGRQGEETRNIFAHHRNSEGQMFESFKTPETGICYSGQWQQGLSVGAHGVPWAITPPFYPSIFATFPLLILNCHGAGKGQEVAVVHKIKYVNNKEGGK